MQIQKIHSKLAEPSVAASTIRAATYIGRLFIRTDLDDFESDFLKVELLPSGLQKG